MTKVFASVVKIIIRYRRKSFNSHLEKLSLEHVSDPRPLLRVPAEHRRDQLREAAALLGAQVRQIQGGAALLGELGARRGEEIPTGYYRQFFFTGSS